jgi:hypothetical protein
MYCPSCGTPNDDTSKFCAKCGTALPVNLRSVAPAAQPVAVSTATNWSGWRVVGWVGLIGSGLSLLAYLLPWLIAPVINLGAVYGQNARDISGLSLTLGTVQLISAITNSGSSALLRLGLGFLPGEYQSLLMVYFIDTLLLAIIPVIGLILLINSYRLIRSSGRLQPRRRLRMMQVLATVGLIPVLVLFIVVQLLIAVIVAYSNPFGNAPDSFSLGLKYFGAGYWLTVAGLIVVIISGPLAAPKNR